MLLIYNRVNRCNISYDKHNCIYMYIWLQWIFSKHLTRCNICCALLAVISEKLSFQPTTFSDTYDMPFQIRNICRPPHYIHYNVARRAFFSLFYNRFSSMLRERAAKRNAISSCVALIPLTDSVCKWRFCGVRMPLITSINMIGKKLTCVAHARSRSFRTNKQKKKSDYDRVTLSRATSGEERFFFPIYNDVPRRGDKRIAHATRRPEIGSVGSRDRVKAIARARRVPSSRACLDSR